MSKTAKNERRARLHLAAVLVALSDTGTHTRDEPLDGRGDHAGGWLVSWVEDGSGLEPEVMCYVEDGALALGVSIWHGGEVVYEDHSRKADLTDEDAKWLQDAIGEAELAVFGERQQLPT